MQVTTPDSRLLTIFSPLGDGGDSLLLLLIKLLLRLLCFLKIEHYSVDTIAQTGGRGAIVKYMTEVGLASAALGFSANHAMGIVRGINDTGFTDGFIKTGPAAAAVEFGIAFKKRIAAGRTVISAHFLEFFKLAGPGSFCSLHPRDKVNIGRKDFFPFFLRHFYLAGIGVGINGIAVLVQGLAFLGGIHILFLEVGGIVLGITALLEQAAEGQEQDAFGECMGHIHITKLRNRGSGGLSGGRQVPFFNIFCLWASRNGPKEGKNI